MSQVLKNNLPAQAAAGATSVTPLGEVSNVSGTDNYALGCSVVAPSLVTGAATNNATINVRVIRGGSAAFTLASLTLGNGTNLPAEVAVAVPVTATVAQQSSLVDGDVIDVQLVQNGTGLALPAGIVCQVEIQ